MAHNRLAGAASMVLGVGIAANALLGPLVFGVIKLRESANMENQLLGGELTSLLMRYLPKKRWRQVHLTSFGAFWLVTLHGLFAGSDTRHLLVGILVSVSMLSVLFLVMVRLLSPSTPTRARVATSRP